MNSNSPHQQIDQSGDMTPAIAAFSAPPVLVSAPVFDPSLGGELEAETAGFNPLMIWNAFRRHWPVIVVLWLGISAGLVVAVYRLVKPVYESFALLRIDTNPGMMGSSRGISNPLSFQKTQVSLITTPNVLQVAILNHPTLNRLPSLRHSIEPEQTIRKALSVSVVDGTELIQISMFSEDAAEAEEIINAVVEEFLVANGAWSDADVNGKIKRLTIEIETQTGILKKERDRVKAISGKNKGNDIDAVKKQHLVSIEQYRARSERLGELQITMATMAAQIEALRARRSAEPTISRRDLQTMVEADADVRAARAVYQKWQAKYQENSGIARKGSDPAVINARGRAKDAKDALDQTRTATAIRIQKQLQQRPVANEAEAVEFDLQMKQITAAALRKQLAELKVESKSMGEDEAELEYARQDEMRERTVLEQLRSQKNAFEFEQRQPKRVSLAQEAKRSNLPQSNKRKMMMAASPFGVLLAVLGLFTLFEAKGARVGTPTDLTTRTNLRVIGVVPPLPAPRAIRGQRDEMRLQRELHEFIQSVDHLRVNLCAGRHPGGREVRCVLITSACGSEGKTTLSAQLAGRCANAGLMTLLIDADLRNPSLSKLLDVPQGPGLIDMLRGDVGAEAATVVIGDAGGFHLLPAGTPEFDPSRLLQGPQMGSLLAKFREQFDLIIIDAPPVLPVPDSLTLGKWADGAVLAVRYDTSRFPLVKEAQRRLAAVGVPVLGAVMNGVRDNHGFANGQYYSGFRAEPTVDQNTAVSPS